METVDQFVNELIKLIPELNKFFEGTRNYWYPKNAPLTLFFSDLAISPFPMIIMLLFASL